jgi:hypothetical protein
VRDFVATPQLPTIFDYESVFSRKRRVGFSDPGMEEAFYESPVLHRFAGVDLGVAAAPDETNILRFRLLLELHKLCGKMLDMRNTCPGSFRA